MANTQEVVNKLKQENEIYFTKAKEEPISSQLKEFYEKNGISCDKPNRQAIDEAYDWIEQNYNSLSDEDKLICKQWKENLKSFVNRLDISDKIKGKVKNDLEGVKLFWQLQAVIDSALESFSIDWLKKCLEGIENIEAPNDKIFHIKYLIWKIEAKWYRVSINQDKIEVENKDWEQKNSEIETVLNSYIFSNRPKKIDIAVFKNAILEMSQYMDTYISARSDSEWKLISENISSEDYYTFMSNKYKEKNIDIGENVAVEQIKTNPLINEEDKAFILSYKQWAYKNFKINDRAKEYAEQQKVAQEKLKWLGLEEYLPEKDGRKLSERMAAFVSNPFAEIWKVMGEVSFPWNIIMLFGLLGSVVSDFKGSMKIIAGWSVAKATWLADWGEVLVKKLLARMPFLDGLFSEEGTPATDPGPKAKVELLPPPTEAQKFLTERVKGSNDQKFLGDAEKLDLNNYLNFINDPDFSEKTLLRHILYTGSDKFSETIFSNDGVLESELLKKVTAKWLDIITFKRILRYYLTWSFLLESDGLKEHKAFETKIGVKEWDNNESKRWLQDKPIKDILEIIKNQEQATKK
jgi:hypothetical protein